MPELLVPIQRLIGTVPELLLRLCDEQIAKAHPCVIDRIVPVDLTVIEFVEDVVREVYLGLKKMDFKWFTVEAETEESIHFHNAYAYAEYSE